MRSTARVTAVLGPTNTGKTHYAIERMLTHRTGVIGLPLRLLAREVYDRIVAQRGPNVVALVTGEERIVPDRTQYWVCTVEAMPLEIGADFIAIDEIQLCADDERGHVFTDRLLRARGLHETLFLGADTMRPAIAALVPGVQFMARPRMSELAYSGSKKIARMPERSAIVGFSVENVYAIAELIRRTKGGCAVVMGALSPRTRNAQVALYQNGDVDYLVATDAIGMGLNLDINHVAFSSTAKFDGRRMRALYPQELAQIAGRAGRHTAPGTFGVTGEARPLNDDVVDAIEQHRFQPVRKLSWRNEQLEFGTVPRLISALERHTDNDWLSRARDADDVTALKTLSAVPEISDRVKTPQDVRLLWDVCRIPDFRGISTSEHANLLQTIFDYLRKGPIPADWLARQIKFIDRTEGDIDTLSRRLAFIRTWTYVTQRKNWVVDESHWRDETRAVEDRLSDALHARLTQRFIDRRTSVLMRRLKQKESLVAEVNDKGEVTVEGEFVGKLEGFRFRQDASASPDEARTLRMAAVQALKPEFHLRSDKFYNAPDTELDFTEQGGLMWGSSAVGKLVAGADALRPTVEAFVDEDAGPDITEKVKRRLQHFIDRKVATLFEPLLAMSRDETLTGMARGFAFQMVEALGIIPRENVADEVKALDQEARGQLRKHGIRFGQYTIFQQLLLKPAPTRLRLVLWSLANGLQEFPESPPPGLVTIPNIADVPQQHYTLAGYRPAGSRAIRIDMLERLADMLRGEDSRGGFEAKPDMLSITGMTLDQFADLMAGMGYKGEKAERPKAKPAAPKELTAEAIAEAAAAAAAASKIIVEDEAAPVADAEVAAATDAAAAPEPAVEMESFYTFTWAPRPRADRRPPRRDAKPAGDAAPNAEKREGGKPRGEGRGDRPAGQGKRPERSEGGYKGKGKKGGKPPQNSPQKFESRPARPEKKIDPDNPFAALAALKGKI
ncbi:helicase-related protein [Pseudorhodobacter wandonensis]|uniref:helicase-related protein n=1 Tax=Pseudorhodobacter wandonensis TaxID=1120568 RepID=UPI00067E27D6|nr:helicase-related protein [Pseudorhodobacter wandonensis]